MNKTTQLARTMIATVLIASCTAWAANAQTNSPPQNASSGQYGWGMMGGYGGGYGMGPGMMGGWGGGYGMGPGMMGGYGGGYGMGPGMMGGYGMGSLGALDLTEEQQRKINQIQDETRKAHWSLMGAMMDQQARLRDLYAAPKQDAAAIDNAHKAISQMQQQMYDTSVNAQKRIEAVLTKEQQEKLKSNWRRGRY